MCLEGDLGYVMVQMGISDEVRMAIFGSICAGRDGRPFPFDGGLRFEIGGVKDKVVVYIQLFHEFLEDSIKTSNDFPALKELPKETTAKGARRAST